MKAPEKLYITNDEKRFSDKCHSASTEKYIDNDIEYIRKDAFIEKALKWYCLDCECNDNCKDTKCFFYREFERYLKGETNALPPKFSNRILNEDGSTSDNWRYRHFTNKMQDAFIEKALRWMISQGGVNDALSGEMVEDFRKYMEGE